MPRTRADVHMEPIEALSEDELQRLLAAFDKRFKRLEDQYLQMIGEQLRDIGQLAPSDVHRLEQIRRMNRNLSQIKHRIALAVDMSDEEVEKILETCAQNDARIATKILGVKDTPNVRDNPYLAKVLEAQTRETAGTMKNLSNTTVEGRFYRDAIDEAVQAVQSGVEDYNTAIRRVVREAGEHGLRVRESKDGTRTRVVDYASGISRRLDTAARMNVLDGMRHMNQDIMNAVGEEFGADGVEIDAHMLCADDHLPYQGRQYSNTEFERIQGMLDRPFGEWNCRHSWHPIILGVSPPNYTEERLEEMRRYSRENITIDGKTKTRYEWSQEMRRVETAIRQQKDTANLARKSGDKALQQRCQGTVLRLNKYYQQLSEASDLKAQFGRTYVPGYTDVKSTNVLTMDSNSAKIQISEKSIVDSNRSVFKHDLESKEQTPVTAVFEKSKLIDENAIRDYIKSDSCNKTIVVHLQNKHIPGTKEYEEYKKSIELKGQKGPSRLSIGIDKAQELVEKYSGNGRIKIGKSGWDKNEVIVDNDEIVGIVVNNLNGVEAETTVFKIHYGDEGVHIVPDYPSKKRKGEKNG